MFKKILNYKFAIHNSEKGMTYVELIVVLAIFSTMSGIVLYNYQDFQTKVEIKSLSNDVALKIVGAQKMAMSGQAATESQQIIQSSWGITNWKPSYGVYFSSSTDLDTDGISFNKKIISFADLNNSVLVPPFPAYDINTSACDHEECIEQININKNYNVSHLAIYCSGNEYSVNNLSIVFTRPNSGAKIQSNPEVGCLSYVMITLAAPNNPADSKIKIYPSGMVELK